jgi:hypothetical protein
MPQVLWTNYFLKHQGYETTDTVMHQDNKSTILLANNGRASSSKRTRHINIRYYFVTDRISGKELRLEYCPTKQMVADFFTKPLQGQLFYNLRAEVMNLPAEYNGRNDATVSDDASVVIATQEESIAHGSTGVCRRTTDRPFAGYLLLESGPRPRTRSMVLTL